MIVFSNMPLTGNIMSSRSAVPQLTSYRPDFARYTVEQEFKQAQQQLNPQPDPYNEYKKLIGDCPVAMQEKIANDKRFEQVHAECDLMVKSALYEQIIPQLLQNPQGLAVFERLHAVTKQVRDECAEQDAQRAREMELLLNDEFVQERLKEIKQEGKHGTEQTNSPQHDRASSSQHLQQNP